MTETSANLPPRLASPNAGKIDQDISHPDAKVNTFSEPMTPEEKKKQVESTAPTTATSRDMKGINGDPISSPNINKDTGKKIDLVKSENKDILRKDSDISSSVSKQSRVVPGGFSINNDTRCGWTDFSSLPNPGQDHLMVALKKSLTDEQIATIYSGSRLDDYTQDNGFLAQQLSDTFYGKWFHNAAALLLAVVLTFILTKLGAGLFACLTVGAFLATYYQTSIRRLRRNIRDDVQREMAMRKLESDHESVYWMNHFIHRFWLIYEPVLCAQVIGTADAILSENCPSFLDSLRLTTFTLGTKPPLIEFVKTYPRTESNIVCMDWKVSFTPTDTTDITPRDLQSHVDPKIVLSIRVGKKMLGAGMPVLLEGLAFTGHLRVRIKMFNEFPHIQTVEACFLEKPTFDYILKPIGGEYLGFDVNNIPGLQSFVRDQVHANLGPMMYAPNVFTVDVAALLAGADTESANGVLALSIHSANGLKISDFLGTLDPYIKVHVGSEQNPELGRTQTIEDNNNPQWNETLYILLNNLTDTLSLYIKDRNTGRKDGDVGMASFDLKELGENDNVLDGLSLAVLHGGKAAGEIKCDMRYFPVSAEEKQEDGTVIPAAESDTGIAQLTVYECKDLGSGKKLDTYAVVTIDGQEKLTTSTYKRSANPRWDKKVETFVTDKSKTKLEVTIKESQLAGDIVLGTWKMMVCELEKALEDNKEWFNLDGIAGKLHLGLKWKPTVMTGFVGGIGRGTYRPPIGVIRAHFYRAKGLRNVEALTGGKSDPYVRILSGMQIRDQTDYILDELDPEWDTALYVPVHSLREDLVFEVMDYNEVSKDKSLGLCDFSIKQVIKESIHEETQQKVYEALEPVERWADLTNAQRKPGKGKVHYKISFHPTLELAKSSADDEKKVKEQTQDKTSPTPETADATTEATTINKRQEKDIHGEDIIYESPDSDIINLPKYTSGILSVKVHEAKIPGNTCKVLAQLLVDSNDPQYKTLPQKGSTIEFGETGDAFVKELDFSNVVIQIVKDTQKKDVVILGHCSLSVSKILEMVMDQQRKSNSKSSSAASSSASNRSIRGESITVTNNNNNNNDDNDKEKENSQEIKLLNIDGGTIRLSFNYFPVVQYILPPEESMENQGTLTVTPVSASHLRAADRNGKSDPFVVFTLNGEKMYKTDVYKKTLNPEFNVKKETFVLPVQRRIGSTLEAIVYDWDQLGNNEELGRGNIPFTGDILESFEAKQFDIHLTGGESTLKVRLLWQPQLLKRERQGTSLLNTTTKAFTAVPGAALGAGVSLAGDAVGLGGKVLGTGGKAVFGGVGKFGSGIRGIGSRLGGHRSSVVQDASPGGAVVSGGNGIVDETAHLGSPNNNKSNLDRKKSIDSLQSSSNMSMIRPNEAIKVSIIGARGLKDTLDCYVRVKSNSKHSLYKSKHIKKSATPEWNESFMANIKPNDKTLEFRVRTRGTITDHDVGFATLDMTQPFEGWLPLSEGAGEINVRLDIPGTRSSSPKQ
ncbi:C2 domain-containing protein [Halteromyces radiatus]|uniref:C2 domain-containing protein n=1 Tax=Halteromyces radiatus TaxID=101107 RepID=UPI00221F278D|nr:C2 domain-containing protein [Halteromyces radiatus]KAI8084738.1 C2 domain-containing protein [Halteromyces radiatus]